MKRSTSKGFVWGVALLGLWALQAWGAGVGNAPAAAVAAVLPDTTLGAAVQPAQPAQPDEATRARLEQQYAQLPLAFEVNQGQTDARVKYFARGPGYALFLTGDEAVFSLRQAAPEAAGAAAQGAAARDSRPAAATRAVLRARLLDADAKAAASGEDELPGKANYLVGSDPAQWHTGIARYARVRYAGVYPGIDLVYHGDQGQLEYDFVLAPQADPGRIRMRYTGADGLRVDEAGNLHLAVDGGELIQHAPVAYQQIGDRRQSVDAGFALHRSGEHTEVAFRVGPYDRSHALIIDPVLSYSTYLGGNLHIYGEGAHDQAFGIAVDGSGSAYVTGWTDSLDFPTAAPFKASPDGREAFVTKLTPDGSALVYSTYLGGDYGRAIAVDGSGSAYVTGWHTGSDFPTTPGAFQSGDGYDAFVTKLTPDGSALVYSATLGPPPRLQWRSSRLCHRGGRQRQRLCRRLYQRFRFPDRGGLSGRQGRRLRQLLRGRLRHQAHARRQRAGLFNLPWRCQWR